MYDCFDSFLFDASIFEAWFIFKPSLHWQFSSSQTENPFIFQTSDLTLCSSCLLVFNSSWIAQEIKSFLCMLNNWSHFWGLSPKVEMLLLDCFLTLFGLAELTLTLLCASLNIFITGESNYRNLGGLCVEWSVFIWFRNVSSLNIFFFSSSFLLIFHYGFVLFSHRQWLFILQAKSPLLASEDG